MDKQYVNRNLNVKHIIYNNTKIKNRMKNILLFRSVNKI